MLIRNARALRQGNQNDEITITYVAVKKTYDALMWQTVQRKALFISQVMSGSNRSPMPMSMPLRPAMPTSGI